MYFYQDNMLPDNLVELDDGVVCTNLPSYSKDSEPCPLYPQTHKHHKKKED